MDRLGSANDLDDLGHRIGQDLAGRASELGDHAGGDRQAQQVCEASPDLSLTRAIGPAQETGPGLRAWPEGPARDGLGELGASGRPASRADEPLEAILDDFGPDLGESGDLMAEGPRVYSVVAVAAAGAGRWLDLDGPGQPLEGDQLTRRTPATGLTPAVRNRARVATRRTEDAGSRAKDRPGRESLRRPLVVARSTSSGSGASMAGDGRWTT